MSKRINKNGVGDLEAIISKISIRICCGMVLPEFGIRWRDISRAVRNARLPMTPSSVAKIISKHAEKTLTNKEILEIVSILRMKMGLTQRRMWHVIKLSEKISDQPVNVLVRMLPARIETALRNVKTNGNIQPKVQLEKMGHLIYVSIKMEPVANQGLVSKSRWSAALYIAHPPGEPVALVSSLRARSLRPSILGLGYMKFEDAHLNGRDVNSLLRISNKGFTDQPDHFAGLPKYEARPCIVRGGIDFTGRASAEQYVAQVLGPDPPRLTELTVTSNKKFYNPDILNKKMKIKLELKSPDVATTLQLWAKNGALHPNSKLIKVFVQSKSNQICIDSDDE